MATVTKSKVTELHSIISRLPLEVSCVAALPELGLRWRDVAKAVRNSRLPMTPNSVAKVLRGYVSKVLTPEQLDDVVPRLRLVLAATQTRTWHVLNLDCPLEDSNVVLTSTTQIFTRIYRTLRGSKVARSMRPDVQTIKFGDFIFVSIQLVNELKETAPLYVVLPPGQPVALVSSVNSSKLLKAVIEGLGFSAYKDAKLYGKDIYSLLRINDNAWNENPDHLTSIPEYAPVPVITKTGIDYTNKNYNQEYVENILGPNPPVLTELNIKMSKNFYDPSRMNKTMNISVKLKSDDVAKTLKDWVGKGALSPTSEFFHIFHQLKSNRLTMNETNDFDD